MSYSFTVTRKNSPGVSTKPGLPLPESGLNMHKATYPIPIHFHGTYRYDLKPLQCFVISTQLSVAEIKSHYDSVTHINSKVPL